MLGQKDYFGSLIMGVGGTEPVTVRETRWGFVIQSRNTGGLAHTILNRVARFATVVVWLAVVGLWLSPLSLDPQMSFILKSFVSVTLLASTYVGVVLTKRLGGYAVHIDTNRRELRTAVLNAKGQSWIKSSYRFDEIGAPVLERGKTETALRSLCLRLRENTDVVPVAVGDETTLLAIHDRLMRDMRPIEERMAAKGLPPLHARRVRNRAAFPLLGPAETEQRARRA